MLLRELGIYENLHVYLTSTCSRDLIKEHFPMDEWSLIKAFSGGLSVLIKMRRCELKNEKTLEIQFEVM